MSNRESLVQLTKKFFSMHWGVEEPEPQWDFSWEWRGPVPNYLVGGVYVLLKDNEILYVGLGISRSSGIYQDRGISRRLMAHVTLSAPKGTPVDSVLRERWISAGVNKVATIGFPKKYSHLAPALEDFLIGHLGPTENKVKRVNT